MLVTKLGKSKAIAEAICTVKMGLSFYTQVFDFFFYVNNVGFSVNYYFSVFICFCSIFYLF